MYVVVMKVVNDNNDEGEKKSKKRERQGYEHIQGDFFNWPSPEFAKCWPVSN